MAIRALLSWTLALSLGAAVLGGCAHPGVPTTGKARQAATAKAKTHLPGQIGLIVQPEAA